MIKTVLLHAGDGDAFESRLHAALDLVRMFEGHLVCLQASPIDPIFIGDPLGDTYALPVVADELRRREEEQRSRLDGRLAREGVSWEFRQFDGSAEHLLVQHSRLCDLIVLSSAPGCGDGLGIGLASSVALKARTPVLAVQAGVGSFEPRAPVMIAWNDTMEAAHSLRLALPLLEASASVHVASVTEGSVRCPSSEVCLYLERQGVTAEFHRARQGDGSVADALLDTAGTIGAGYIVMGAYGHSRFAEAVLGGVTRDLLSRSPLPLLLAH